MPLSVPQEDAQSEQENPPESDVPRRRVENRNFVAGFVITTTLCGILALAITEYLIDHETLSHLSFVKDEYLSLLVVALIIFPHLHMAGEVIYKVMYRMVGIDDRLCGLSREAARWLVKSLAWLEVVSRMVMTWLLCYLLTGGGSYFNTLAPFLAVIHLLYLCFYYLYIETNYAEDGFEQKESTCFDVSLFTTVNAFPVIFQSILVVQSDLSNTFMAISLVAVYVGFIGAALKLYLNHKSDQIESPEEYTRVHDGQSSGETQGEQSEPDTLTRVRRSASDSGVVNPPPSLASARTVSDESLGSGPDSEDDTVAFPLASPPTMGRSFSDLGMDYVGVYNPPRQQTTVVSSSAEPEDQQRTDPMVDETAQRGEADSRTELPLLGFGLTLITLDVVLYAIVTGREGAYDSVQKLAGEDGQNWVVVVYALAVIVSVLLLSGSALSRRYIIHNPFAECLWGSASQESEVEMSELTAGERESGSRASEHADASRGRAGEFELSVSQIFHQMAM